MITRITQSFLKDFRDFLFGSLCGNIVRERWVNDRLIEDPEEKPGAMQLGSFFEYRLSMLIFPSKPALPKNGRIPVGNYKVSVLKKNGGSPAMLDDKDLYDDYKDACANAKYVAGYLKEMGLEVYDAQVLIEKADTAGTLDLVCRVTRDIVLGGISLTAGEFIIIDVKYSGLISETTSRFNKHGWKWSKIQKEYHGTQAIHYHHLGDGEMKFFFLVVNSSNGEGECKFFYVQVDECMTERHLAEGRDYKVKLEFMGRSGGLVPRPHFLTCRKCALRNECKDKHTFPHAEVVNLYED